MEIPKIVALSRMQLFSSLLSEELEEISPHVVMKTFRRNETILHEEDTNEYMYFIVYGRVKVSHIASDGKETVMAIHNAGDFFGEMSLIDGATMPAAVIAKEKSLLAIISRSEFYSLLYRNNKILEKILHILCYRLRESWKKVQILSSRNATQRVRLLFSTLCEDHGGNAENGMTIKIKLTHQDIADMTGLTRESVSRVFEKWKREKKISILRNRFIRLSKDFFTSDIEDVI